MRDMKLNALHRIRPTARPNAALAHAALIMAKSSIANKLLYNLPRISLTHIQKLTTSRGIIQFSKLSSPDIRSGYTLDDNARAFIALCKHYQLTKAESDLPIIQVYLDFILCCQQDDGTFLEFIWMLMERSTRKPITENLQDANGRAVWALGGSLPAPEYLTRCG